MLGCLLQRQIMHLQMDGLVFLVVGVGDKHRGEPVKGEFIIPIEIVNERIKDVQKKRNRLSERLEIMCAIANSV
jgi:hypothetical protein